MALESASIHTDQPPAWLSWEPSDLSGLKPDSLLLVILRLAASDNKNPSLPDHLENHLIWVDSIKVIPPLALSNMSLECIVGSLINPNYHLFNFIRKPVEIILYVHLSLVLCIILYTDLSYLQLLYSESIMSDWYCLYALSRYWKLIPGISIP